MAGQALTGSMVHFTIGPLTQTADALRVRRR
jgi:hypothetical protein